MAKLTKKQVADKTADLTKVFGDYVFTHPDVLNAIPDGAVVAFLDEKDSAFNREAQKLAQRNRALCEESGEGPRPVVYITVSTTAKTVRVPRLTVELEPA